MNNRIFRSNGVLVPAPKQVSTPFTIEIDGETFQRIRFSNSFLDTLISSQPLYGPST